MHHELLRVNGLPVLQNKLYPTAADARAAPRGTMRLVQSRASGLVFNEAFDASLLTYDADYQNEQAHSRVFQEHLANVLAVIRRHFSSPSILEVGCGKAYFLEYMRAAGYNALGIDPAYEGDSPNVIKAAFAPGLGISADAIVLRHVLEHIPDPVAFLRSIALANGGRGQIYIEVPCFDWICSNGAWFDIFYEHVNYFRLADFHRMFAKVEEAGHLFGGQYLYVVADLSSLREPVHAPGNEAELPGNFWAGIEASKQRSVAMAGPKAIWGASSKGVIFSHHMQAAGVVFDIAIDINPVKQQCYMAGTGLQIVSPESAFALLPEGSAIFVMNPNYFDEIAAQSQGRFKLLGANVNDLPSTTMEIRQ